MTDRWGVFVRDPRSSRPWHERHRWIDGELVPLPDQGAAEKRAAEIHGWHPEWEVEARQTSDPLPATWRESILQLRDAAPRRPAARTWDHGFTTGDRVLIAQCDQRSGALVPGGSRVPATVTAASSPLSVTVREDGASEDRGGLMFLVDSRGRAWRNEGRLRLIPAGDGTGTGEQ